MERPQQRPRTKSRTFSLLSIKSGSSGSSKIKVDDLRETEAAKQRSRFSGVSKVNPLRAMNEAEPAAVQAQEQATIAPLRSLQHKDTRGNVITDPDSSNPTRSRIERPLDTIRSFDAAVDASYRRRTQVLRAESDNALTNQSSRRSSYYGGYETPNSPITPSPLNPRYSPANGFNGGRNAGYAARDYNYGTAAPSSWQHRRGVGQRMHSAPMSQRQADYNAYPPQSYGQSYGRNSGYYGQPEQHDGTATSGSIGSQSDPWANSTNPSSENSSMERMHAARSRDGVDPHVTTPKNPPPQEGPSEEYWPDDPNAPGTQSIDYASTLQTKPGRYDPSRYNPGPQHPQGSHQLQPNATRRDSNEHRQHYASHQSPFMRGGADQGRGPHGQAIPGQSQYPPTLPRPAPNQVAYTQQQKSQEQWESRRLQRLQSNRPPPTASRPEKPEKRKSWFRRTFSKS